MKNIFIILAVIMPLISCDNKDNDIKNDDIEGFYVVSTDIELLLKDKDGNDLLNPKIANSYNTKDLKILYVDKNGNAKVQFDGNLSASNFYMMFQHEGKYRVRIFANDDESIDFPVTIVQWNDRESDTIKCEVERVGNVTRIIKVWVNDSLMYDGVMERVITLIK